jgi:hypothetical protein
LGAGFQPARTQTITELENLLDQLRQIEAEEVTLLSLAKDRNGQVRGSCLAVQSHGYKHIRSLCICVSVQAHGHLASGPAQWIDDQQMHISVCFLKVWVHIQAAVYSELVRIEEQQQKIMQQLAVVKKER